MAGGLYLDDLDDSLISTDGERLDFAKRLVSPLRFRYALVFLAIASLLLADQAVIQPLLMRLNGYAPVINMAGRQRMLSQKLAKQSLSLEFGVAESPAEARRDELSQTVRQWSAAHRALRHGDPEQGIGPITAPRIAAALRDLEPHFAAMRAAANQLAAAQQPAQPIGQRHASRMALVRAILDHEASYLSGMEQVVAMLESEAQERVAGLRLCAAIAAVMAILLLASLYAFVLRPATTLIRQQLQMLSASDARHRKLAALLSRARDDLERRVAERTSELRQANSTLEREMGRRQRIERRMRRLSSDLAHAARVTALGQLATGLAHELNQPLGAVANYAGTCEILLEKELPGDHASRRAITEVKRAALRAGEIVRRMRNFIKRGPEQRSAVELNDLVREVAQLCEPELRRCDVEMALDLSEEPTAVFVDPIQIQQVLVNLIRNSIQAMHNAECEKRLRVCTSPAADGVQVDVIDSGPGFSRPDPEKPFEPFFSTKADGLGMGLAISQTLIEQHQGRLWAANNTDGGAIVSFWLPEHSTYDAGLRTRAHSLCG